MSNPYYAHRSTIPPERAGALAAARRGWHVLPLVPGSKRPAVAAWEQWATCDAGRIRGTWPLTNPVTDAHGAHQSAGSPRRPVPGVGIACGPSGLVVLDLDRPKPGQVPPPPQWAGRAATGEIRTGADVFKDLCRRHGQAVPVTLTVRTARGGWHLYFTHPPLDDVTATGPAGGPWMRNTAGALGWLVDTRAHGGYVVAPPTRTTDGAYRVVRAAAVAPLPDWLAHLLTPRPVPAAEPVTVALAAAHGRTIARTIARPDATGAGVGLSPAERSRAYVEAAIRGELARVAAAAEGQRNRSLFVAACALGQLAAGGALADTDVRALLRQAAGPHIAARAYTSHEAEATIRSGMRAGARRPRRIAS